jgi:hypothetical protein
MSVSGEAPPSSVVAKLKTLAPYLIAAVALVWVSWRTNWHEALTDIRQAPVAEFLIVSTVMLTLNWMLDTFAMTSVFTWFGCKVRYRELLIVRGSTYLWALFNYHFGQAAIVGYLYRVCKVPFLRASGWILFIIGINVGTLFLLGSAGTAGATGQLSFLRWVPLISAVGVVVYAVLLVAKPPILAERRMLAPLFEMGIAGHIKGVAVRLPHVANLILWQWWCLRMFGFHVSLWHALLYMPAYFAVSALPINFNGLGVAQVVAIAFFGQFATVPAGTADVAGAQRAAVMAWSVSVQGFSIFQQLVLGFICLRPAQALGVRARSVDVETAAEAAS